MRIAELRYKPLRQAQGRSWGESRYSFGATPTARLSSRRRLRAGFTGQREEAGIGLYSHALVRGFTALNTPIHPQDSEAIESHDSVL